MNILKLFKRRKPHPPEELTEADRFEVVLSGSGGQGMILAGRILAEAATIYDKKRAVMSQSYGPEARGGASRAEVVISSGAIDYPKVMHVNTMLALTQEAMNKYGNMLGSGGLLIVDDTFVKKVPPHVKNVFKSSFTSLAIKLLGVPLVANIVALGSLSSLTGIVSREALIKAVLGRVPEKALVLNRIAVDIGFKVVEESSFSKK